MYNGFLYLATVLIWGSTWFVITFQLGPVPSLLSVAYRFGLAAVMLVAFLVVRKQFKPFHFSRRQHMFMALQGLCLFCLNYWLFYQATHFITSGLVAVVFSLIAIMNVFNQALFFKIRIRPAVLIGSAFGLVGISLIFWPEISHFSLQGDTIKGMGLAVAATYVASLGNMASLRNTKDDIPVVQSNSFGMVYGSLFCLLIALSVHREVSFDMSFHYLWSLLYLALFGSVIAFGSYLTLIKNIGSDKAAYSAVLFPIVALLISTVFEGYEWSLLAIIGIGFAVAGNVIAMASPQTSFRFLNLRG